MKILVLLKINSSKVEVKSKTDVVPEIRVVPELPELVKEEFLILFGVCIEQPHR